MGEWYVSISAIFITIWLVYRLGPSIWELRKQKKAKRDAFGFKDIFTDLEIKIGKKGGQ